MDSNIDVSIIVPAKNTEAYVGECLQSLANIDSSGFTYEVVMVDDASTDGTNAVMSDYCTRYPNFILLEGPGVSVAAARNLGLEHSRGRYIGWVDSDDYVEPSMYKKLLAEAEKSGADVVMCDYGFYPSKVAGKDKWFREINGKVTGPHEVERNTQLWNKLFRSEFLSRTSFAHLMETCSEGACALLLILAGKVTTLKEILYWYRVGHVSSSSSYSNVEKYVGNVDLTRSQQIAAKQIGLDEKWNSYFEYRVIYSLLQVALIAARNGEKAAYEQAVAQLRDMRYEENDCLSTILIENHGKARAFALSRLVPFSWLLARFLGSMF